MLLLIASILVFLTFIMHTIRGDKEYKKNEPEGQNESDQEYWTMRRGALLIIQLQAYLAFPAKLMMQLNMITKPITNTATPV